MKFTHADIEADRYKPVGSLFLDAMDRDSLPPRVHQNKVARSRYNRSLANTPFSIYSDPAVAPAEPLTGRRHYGRTGQGNYSLHYSPANSPTRRPRTASVTRAFPDQLGQSLMPKTEEAPTVRQKRFIPEPRGSTPSGRSGADTPLRDLFTGASLSENNDGGRAANTSAVKRRGPRPAYARDHLSLESLIPFAEPVKERPVPPPMEKKARTTGVRMFPERRSASVGDHRTGVALVRPPQHWRSVNDRQWDFLEIGVNAKESATPRYRNQSSIGLGGGPVYTGVASKGSNGRTSLVEKESHPHWRGRGRSANPERRSYDIITGCPTSF